VRGNITNTGHSVIVKIDNAPMPDTDEEVNLNDDDKGFDDSSAENSVSSPELSGDDLHERNKHFLQQQQFMMQHQHHRSSLAGGTAPGLINRDGDPFRGSLPVHKPVNITGGPLTYSYQVEEIHLHYGTREGVGSEHTINGHAFPAEVSPIRST
jgi:hypothetical protein